MRAIIIEEERFAEVCDLMEKRANDIADRQGTAEYERVRAGVTPEQWKAMTQQIHRMMHYEFVRWAQSHGATCVRR